VQNRVQKSPAASWRIVCTPTALARPLPKAFGSLLFTLDIAATVERLVPEAEKIQQEMIDELEERGQ
jgi:hypothetical protein